MLIGSAATSPSKADDRPHLLPANAVALNGAQRLRARLRPRVTLPLVLLGLATALTVFGCSFLQNPAFSLDGDIAAGLVPLVDSGARPLVGEAPASKLVQLGHSVNGTPLIMEVFGDGPDRILIVGGIHGNEPTGAMVATRLARFLRDDPRLAQHHTIGILAQANPDGLLGNERANANGVDLNRNFPSADWHAAGAGGASHGSCAASEPETRAVMRAVEIFRPCRIVDIHSIGEERYCNNYDGPGEKLATLMSNRNGYPVRAEIGYPTPGALGNWAGLDCGIPTITLELPRELDGAECWRQNSTALLAFIAGGSNDIGR